jgi:hypothetical protein
MTPEELFEKQLRAGREHRSLLEATADLLLRHDPLDDGDPYHNKYVGEAQEILLQLRGCRSAADVTRAVHSVFVRWADEKAGPLERYEQIGSELWKLCDDHAA